MFDKIKGFIAKIKTKRMLSKCYNEMESKGIAVFCMCSGKWHNLGDVCEIPYKQCTICPYFRNIKGG